MASIVDSTDVYNNHNMASSDNMDVFNYKTTLLYLVGMVATQEAPDF